MAALEGAMNEAIPIHLMTGLASRAERSKPGPRTNLRGGVVLMLVWIVLEGTFLWNIARPPPGDRAWESTATPRAGALALGSSPLPCSP